MVIQGGHDTTLNVLQFFMQKAFNIDLQYIKFGANIYFELHKDEINNTNKYNYTVKYFYDGKLLLTLDYDSFKQKVLETVWNEEQIHNFCFQEENDKNEQKDDNEVKVSYSLFIALIITTILLLITTIIFSLLFLYFRHKASSITIVSNDELIE